ALRPSSLGQSNCCEIERSGWVDSEATRMTGNQRYLSGTLREDKRVPLVNFRKLPHAFVLGDGLIRNTDSLTLTFLGPKTAPSFSRLFASRCRWGNRVVVAKIVCRDLHD